MVWRGVWNSLKANLNIVHIVIFSSVLAYAARPKLASGVWPTHLQIKPKGILSNQHDNCIVLATFLYEVEN